MAFSMLKSEITKPCVLALQQTERYQLMLHHTALEPVLLQRNKSRWKPVAFALRSMSDSEKRHAQTEEALAIIWAYDKLSVFVIRKHFTVKTNHKPLVPLLSSKHLDSLPPRVLRFWRWMAWFDYSIEHKPGKLLFPADALSRAPCSAATADNSIAFLTMRSNSLLMQSRQLFPSWSRF